jgi:hypothetical protein
LIGGYNRKRLRASDKRLSGERSCLVAEPAVFYTGAARELTRRLPQVDACCSAVTLADS